MSKYFAFILSIIVATLWSISVAKAFAELGVVVAFAPSKTNELIEINAPMPEYFNKILEIVEVIEEINKREIEESSELVDDIIKYKLWRKIIMQDKEQNVYIAID